MMTLFTTASCMALRSPALARAAIQSRAGRVNMMSTYATFKTSKGDIKAELFVDKVPITASNFADLSRTGFYDGLTCARARRPTWPSPRTPAPLLPPPCATRATM